MDKITQARSRMLFKNPFFASMVLSLPLIRDDAQPTACTDMKSIMYNHDFIESLDMDTSIFVLAHEVGHVIFMHGVRCGYRDHELWNKACDYAVNLLLRDCGFTLWEHCLIDARFAGMSAEQIYDILLADGGSSKSDGLGRDLVKSSNMSAEEQARIIQTVKQQTAQAATTARMSGNLSAGLSRIIENILNPVLPWYDLLREYMTHVVHADESWSRRNRRFSDVVLPGRHSHAVGEIVIICDTSGSIGEKELNQIAAEVEDISAKLNPERIRIAWCDAKVVGEQVFELGEPLKFKPKGGGGTDMRVALEHVVQYDPVVCLLCTDGYTPWPDREPDYPLIVVCSTDQKVPVGNVVRIL